jgi:hypothetical protein
VTALGAGGSAGGTLRGRGACGGGFVDGGWQTRIEILVNPALASDGVSYTVESGV